MNQLAETLATHQNMNPRPDCQWASYEGFVLDQGREFIPNPFPEYYQRGEKKLCFMNALHLALDEELMYVEGYAMRPNIGMPILHAWCTDGDDLVIDPTWDDPETCLYYGVVFDLEWVLETSVDTGYYGILGNDWMRECRILKGDTSWTPSMT